MRGSLVRRLALAALALVSACTARAGELPPPWLPLDPGAARCLSEGSAAALVNAAVRFSVRVDDGRLHPAALYNGFAHEQRALEGELFSVTPRSAAAIPSGHFALLSAPACSPVAPRQGAARRHGARCRSRRCLHRAQGALACTDAGRHELRA